MPTEYALEFVGMFGGLILGFGLMFIAVELERKSLSWATWGVASVFLSIALITTLVCAYNAFKGVI